MNIGNLREYAKTVSAQQDISEKAYKGLTAQCAAIKTKFMTALDAVAKLYPLQNEAYTSAVTRLNTVIESISTLETGVDVELTRLNNIIIRGQARIANIRETTNNLLSESYDSLDATSKRLLADYTAEYKAATYTLWVKVALILGLMFVMKEHIKDILVAYVVVYVVVYIGVRFYTAATTRSAGATL